MREDQVASKTTWAWVAWLTALCAAIIVYSLLRGRGNTSNVAYLIGYNLPIGIVIWGVFQLTAGRKLGRRKAVTAFLAVWCALVIGSLVGYAQQRIEAVQAVSEIQNSYAAMVAKSAASTSVPPHSGSIIEGESTPSGQFGEITRYMKDLMTKAAALQASYKTALLQIGWNTILDPARLGRDTNLNESRDMLRRASDIVRKYHAKNDQLLVDERADISNLNISANVKDAMRRGFDKNAKMGRKQIDAMWAIQAQILSKFEKIINLLDNRRGAWRVEGKHVMFSNQADLDAFNNDLRNIHDLVVKERAMHDQNAKLVGDNLKQLKNELTR